MSGERDTTYCRCGARLARDNAAGTCTRCSSRDASRLTAPPLVPVDFWYADDLRAACAQRHMGRVIRAYRHHPFHGPGPLSQDLVASWMGLTQAQLSRLENGPGLRDVNRLTAWATMLAIPAQMLWFALPSAPAAEESPARGSKDRLALIEALRLADRQVGGAHLYATVNSRLVRGVVPVPRQARDAQCSASTAVLCEMAGWMAHDAGADDRAHHHLRQAAVLARSSGDLQLTAQIYASMSHLNRQQGDAAQALGQVRSGLAALHEAHPHGCLKGRLLVMRACALATSGKAIEASRAVAEAEGAFLSGCDDPSPWLSPFDEVALTMEVARCLLHLGDLSQAEGRLRTVLLRRRTERIRSRALAQLLLVTVLLARDRVDEACHAVADTIDSTTGLGSAVVIGHLRHATVLLRSHAGRSREVRALLECIRDTVQSRAWIGILDGDHRVGG